MTHVEDFFRGAAGICRAIDCAAIERLALELAALRERHGRLFILGVGGSAANASHAVNDFRKLCELEAYAATDNVSELTARTNDEGWHGVFSEWLRVSRLGPDDAVLVFSVGGGDLEKNVSVNLIHAVDAARRAGARVFGVLGRAGGYTAKLADVAIVVPIEDAGRMTPYAESFQALVWHCLVSHPALQTVGTKW